MTQISSGLRTVTRNGVMSGPGSMDYEHDMGSYVQEMADWLDDEEKIHPYNGESVLALDKFARSGGYVLMREGRDESPATALCCA